MNAIYGAASSLKVEYFDPVRHAMPVGTNAWCDLWKNSVIDERAMCVWEDGKLRQNSVLN
jgi:hypothetical protein